MRDKQPQVGCICQASAALSWLRWKISPSDDKRKKKRGMNKRLILAWKTLTRYEPDSGAGGVPHFESNVRGFSVVLEKCWEINYAVLSQCRIVAQVHLFLNTWRTDGILWSNRLIKHTSFKVLVSSLDTVSSNPGRGKMWKNIWVFLLHHKTCWQSAASLVAGHARCSALISTHSKQTTGWHRVLRRNKNIGACRDKRWKIIGRKFERSRK